MANRERVAFEDTGAADVDVDALPTYTTFVKLANLIEVPFQVVHAEITESSFDASKTCAKVTFEYLDVYGDVILPTEEEDEGVYQFTTEQRAIKAQVARWEETGVDWSKLTVGPLTVSIYGSPGKGGNYPICFAGYEVEEKEPPRKPVPSQPIHRDTGVDNKRQILAGKSTIPSRATQPKRPTR